MKLFYRSISVFLMFVIGSYDSSSFAQSQSIGERKKTKNETKSEDVESSQVLLFELQFGKPLDPLMASELYAPALQGDWIQELKPPAPYVDLDALKELKDSGLTDDELAEAKAMLTFKSSLKSRFFFSPIKITNDGKLVMGNMLWNAAKQQFRVSNQEWDLSKFGKAYVIGGHQGAGKSLLQFKYDKKLDELTTHKYNYQTFRRAFDEGKINAIVSGNALIISQDKKLDVFMADTTQKHLEEEPFSTFFRIRNGEDGKLRIQSKLSVGDEN